MKFATLKIKKIQLIAIALCAVLITYNTAVDTGTVNQTIQPAEQIRNALATRGNVTDEVKKFYAAINYRPLWVVYNGLSTAAKNAVKLMKHAELEGLNPHKYNETVTKLSQLLKQQAKTRTPIMRNPEWVSAELLTTQRMLDYSKDLNSGMMRPSSVHPIFKYPNPKIDAITILAEAVEDNCIGLYEVAPKHTQYKRLKKHLAWLIKKNNKQGDLPKITAKSLRLGDQNKEVVALRKILISLGYLKKRHSTSDIFDSNLDKALKKFQKAHTLVDDGVAGSKTKARLNMTWHDRIIRVLANMERWRWVQQNLKGKHIYVNVALYEVRAMRGNKEELVSPAIVGQKSRRTPIFNTHATDVVINPSWGVPNGIFMKDKLRKLRANPGYASSRGYSIYDRNGNRLDPYSINWHAIGPGNIPIRLRQRPGRSNALGQVKINLSMNKYLVYMHDTPTKSLFNKTTRTFSSGCVRLKKPQEIAAWIMDKNTSTKRNWKKKDIQGIIDKRSTRSIMVKHAVPVHFIYMTVWVEKNGQVRYSDDPYNLDQIHISKLRQVIKHLDYSKLTKPYQQLSELGPCQVPSQDVAYAGAPLGLAGGNAPKHYVAPQQNFNYGARDLEPDIAYPSENYENYNELDPANIAAIEETEGYSWQSANYNYYNSEGQDLRTMHQHQPDPAFGP